jgi:hypothetical protein
MNKILENMSHCSVHRINKFFILVFPLAVALFLLLQQSCKKEEECIPPQLDSITYEGGSVSVDNLIPTKRITLHGKHLKDVTKIIINDLSYDATYLYHPDTTITFAVPYVLSHITSSDSLTVSKSCGSSMLEVTIMTAPAYIKSISNEFAVAGDVITLKGKFFVELERVTFMPDSIEGEIVEGYIDSICQVIVPEGVVNQGEIVLTSLSGDGSSAYNIDFNDSTGLLCNFDNIGTWNEWGGSVIQNDQDLSIPPANGYFFVADLGNISPGSGEIESSILPVTISGIPDYSGNLTPNYFALQAEIFLQYPWKCGYYKILIGAMNDAEEMEYSYEYNYQPWSDTINYAGEFMTTGWETVTIPLTKFLLSGSTSVYLQSYSQLRMINYMQWSFVDPTEEDGGKPINHFKLALDNIRLAQIIEE